MCDKVRFETLFIRDSVDRCGSASVPAENTFGNPKMFLEDLI